MSVSRLASCASSAGTDSSRAPVGKFRNDLASNDCKAGERASDSAAQLVCKLSLIDELSKWQSGGGATHTIGGIDLQEAWQMD